MIEDKLAQLDERNSTDPRQVFMSRPSRILES